MKPRTVLIVDDDRIIREQLEKYLKINFFKTLLAADGRSALEIITGEDVDILLLDVKLPDIDGLEVLAKVKEKKQDCEVILITGFGTQEIAIQSLRKGAIDYIEKPIETDELSAALGRAQEKLAQREGLAYKNTLLVIDDNQEVAIRLKKFLDKEGYDVFGAYSGKEGLDIIKNNKIDVVITDIKMSDIDGIEVVQKAKSLYPDIEGIMVTGYKEQELAIKSLRVGAIDYITKPVNLEELLFSVKKAVERINLNRNRLYRDRELKISERMAASAARGIEEIMESMMDCVAVVDVEGRVTQINKVSETMFGNKKDEIIDKTLSGLLVEEDRPRFMEGLKGTIEAGFLRNFECAVLAKDGRKVPISVNITVLKDTEGNLKSMVAVLRDISELKRAQEKEKELAAAAAAAAAAETEKKRAAELEKAYSELKKTQAKLIQMEKLSAVGQLGAGMAHEINNPMAIITSTAQYLLKKLRGKNLNEISTADLIDCLDGFKKIAETGQRCGSITSRVLQFSSQKSPKMELVDINELAEEVLLIVAHNLYLRKININRRLTHGLPKVKGDSDQLKQVFLNMILNAQQAMPDGGELTVETLCNFKKKLVEIKFADTGVGIPEEIRGKIFDPFFSTRRVGEGTGLGLSVSYGIIKAHNGTIDVESEIGKGTTFTIKLPVEIGEGSNAR